MSLVFSGIVGTLPDCRECMEAHLDLMMFLLKEGDLYLSWVRCRELWETLVENPNSTQGCSGLFPCGSSVDRDPQPCNLE